MAMSTNYTDEQLSVYGSKYGEELCVKAGVTGRFKEEFVSGYTQGYTKGYTEGFYQGFRYGSTDIMDNMFRIFAKQMHIPETELRAHYWAERDREMAAERQQEQEQRELEQVQGRSRAVSIKSMNLQ